MRSRKPENAFQAYFPSRATDTHVHGGSGTVRVRRQKQPIKRGDAEEKPKDGTVFLKENDCTVDLYSHLVSRRSL